MNLIRKLIENGAVGAVDAGAVASNAMPLFARLTKRDVPIKVRITKKQKEKKVPTKGLGIKESFQSLSEMNDSGSSSATQHGSDTFDTTEVVSKLKSLENKDSVDKHETQAFVLEDDDGNMVKIWVRSDQAANFEAALNAFLSDDENEGQGMPEIAEILFKLKDRFDIVDVQWPDVPEDEEQEVSLAGGQEGMPGAEGEQMPGAEGELDLGDMGADPAAGGEGEVKGLLTQVIDMMKADAEARKAEAHARAAEAKARESELATQQVYAKVKQEEQILDMESQEKKQKEADKEAKRLAQLARWKHEMEDSEGASFDQEPIPGGQSMPTAMGREEEETRRPAAMKPQQPHKGSTVSGRVSPSDVANYILNRVR